MRSKLIDAFVASSPAQRRLFLAQMDLNHTDPDSRGLHRVLTELHGKLIEIHGDDEDE